MPFHLDHQTLLSHHDRLGCERIIVTHMSPDMLVRQSESEFECASDGLVAIL